MTTIIFFIAHKYIIPHLIPGNESSGLSRDVLRECNDIIYISPMNTVHHYVDSLNVSVATGMFGSEGS